MRPRRSVVPALAVATTLLLGGCGGDDGSADGPGAASSSPPGASGQPSSSSQPSQSPTAKTTGSVPPGRVKVTAGVPAGFPSDDIPLLDEKVLIGQPGEPGGHVAWSIVMQVKGDIEDIADEAGAKLEDAGFTAGPKTSVDSLEVRSYSNADYEIGITVAKTGQGNTLTYVISES